VAGFYFRGKIMTPKITALFIGLAAGFSVAILVIMFYRPAEQPVAAPVPAVQPAAVQAPASQTPATPRISVQEAFQRLQEAAAAGNIPAMLNLAEFYGRGWGVKQNYTERFNWYQKAAEAGDPRGIYQAALCRELGLGTPVDPEAARAGFEKAAEAGLAQAHLKLAEGLLATDPVKAAGLLEEALAGGLPLAANMLGRLYLQGAGELTADAGKARQALQKGAELVDPEALKNLAVMFRQGWGGPADPAEALKRYLAAREAGWQGLDTALTELEGELGPQAAREAAARAQAWLMEYRKAQ
jgi:TPR repeat protein